MTSLPNAPPQRAFLPCRPLRGIRSAFVGCFAQRCHVVGAQPEWLCHNGQDWIINLVTIIDPLFRDLWQMLDLESHDFGSVTNKGVTSEFLGSVANKGVRGVIGWFEARNLPSGCANISQHCSPPAATETYTHLVNTVKSNLLCSISGRTQRSAGFFDFFCRRCPRRILLQCSRLVRPSRGHAC